MRKLLIIIYTLQSFVGLAGEKEPSFKDIVAAVVNEENKAGEYKQVYVGRYLLSKFCVPCNIDMVFSEVIADGIDTMGLRSILQSVDSSGVIPDSSVPDNVIITDRPVNEANMQTKNKLKTILLSFSNIKHIADSKHYWVRVVARSGITIGINCIYLLEFTDNKLIIVNRYNCYLL